MGGMIDTEAYKLGWAMGQGSAGSQIPSDADPSGERAKTYAAIHDWRSSYFPFFELWEAWRGDFKADSPHNVAVSVFVACGSVLPPLCEESDFLAAMPYAMAWWKLLFLADAAAGKLRDLSDAETWLADSNFVKGFVDGAVEAFSRRPGQG